MMTSHQGSINKDGIHDNIQLSRKHQRAVAGKPNNDPSWSSPHVECTTTVSLRTSYRNFQRARLRTTGSSPAFTINLDRKPRIPGDAPLFRKLIPYLEAIQLAVWQITVLLQTAHNNSWGNSYLIGKRHHGTMRLVSNSDLSI